MQQQVTQQDIATLEAEARASSRGRSHLLLHEDHADPVQRLLISFQRGTYIQPHCHPEQCELIIPLEGTLRLFRFDQAGAITSREDIAPGGIRCAQIPAGEWHTVLAVTATALLFESKPGPYRPGKFAPWAPAEGDPRVGDYCKALLP